MTDEIFRPKEIATLHRIAALSDDELTALFDFARERAASIRAAREAAASAATQKAAAEKAEKERWEAHWNSPQNKERRRLAEERDATVRAQVHGGPTPAELKRFRW